MSPTFKKTEGAAETQGQIQFLESKRAVELEVSKAARNYVLGQDGDGTYVQVYSMKKQGQPAGSMKAFGIDVSGSNKAGNTWQVHKDEITANADALKAQKTQGDVAVVLYGVTPEQSEHMRNALVNAGVNERDIQYDGTSCMGYSVGAENYENAGHAAIDAKMTGPDPGQGMTDLFGAQIMVALVTAKAYEKQNPETVGRIIELVDNGKVELKPVATTGNIANQTEWYVGKFSDSKNDWFVGKYTDGFGGEYDVIRTVVGEESKTYVLPKGAISYVNNTDVGLDGISFEHAKVDAADVNSHPIIQSQRAILENLECFGAVRHVLINNQKDDVNFDLKSLLSKMNQSVVNSNESVAESPSVYFALHNGETLPKGAEPVARIYFELPGSVVVPGTKTSTEKDIKKYYVPQFWGGAKSEGGGSGSRTCDAYGMSSGYGGHVSTFLNIGLDARYKIKDASIQYKEKNGMIEFSEDGIYTRAELPNYKPWESSLFLKDIVTQVKKSPKNNAGPDLFIRQPSFDNTQLGRVHATLVEHSGSSASGEADVHVEWGGELAKINVKYGGKGGDVYTVEAGGKTFVLTKTGSKNEPWEISISKEEFGENLSFGNRIYSIKDGNDLNVRIVSLDRSDLEAVPITSENYARLLPFISKQKNDGSAMGAGLVVAQVGEEYGAETPAPLYLYHGGELLHSDLKAEEASVELSTLGCAGKEIKVAMAAAKDNLAYAIEGADGKTYVVVRENTGSMAERYSIKEGMLRTEMVDG